MRRNNIVRYADERSWFYGRVIKLVGDDSVMWLCSGLHFHVSKMSELVVCDYKGSPEWAPEGSIRYYHRKPDGSIDFTRIKFERKPRFDRMTSLKTLKRRATRYHGRNVWKTPEDYEFIRRAD